MSEKYLGKIKFLNEERGFGFIKDDAGEDIYFPANCIIGEGIAALNIDHRVSFTKVNTDRGWQAENVTVVDEG